MAADEEELPIDYEEAISASEDEVLAIIVSCCYDDKCTSHMYIFI